MSGIKRILDHIFPHHTNYDVHYIYIYILNFQNVLLFLFMGRGIFMEEVLLGGWLLCVEGDGVSIMVELVVVLTE